MQSNTGREASFLETFQGILQGQPPEVEAILPLLRDLESAGLDEEALRRLKRAHPASSTARHPWNPLRMACERSAERTRTRRMSNWQHDPRRRTLRLEYQVLGPAAAMGASALQGLLAGILRDAGLVLALGLEKHPRPLLRLGHPLPPGVEGLAEQADAVLAVPSGRDPEALARLLDLHCPEGLRVLSCEELPSHASPVLELGREAHWRWTCPAALRQEAERRLSAFMEAPSWAMEKTGKVGGQKQVKRVEVRPFVLSAAWEGADLLLVTRIAPGEALNPLKVLCAVLGLEGSALTGFRRERVLLREDARLAQPHRFEPKLSNIFEDAVLLEEGPGPAQDGPDEDDEDDATVLGG